MCAKNRTHHTTATLIEHNAHARPDGCSYNNHLPRPARAIWLFLRPAHALWLSRFEGIPAFQLVHLQTQSATTKSFLQGKGRMRVLAHVTRQHSLPNPLLFSQ